MTVDSNRFYQHLWCYSKSVFKVGVANAAKGFGDDSLNAGIHFCCRVHLIISAPVPFHAFHLRDFIPRVVLRVDVFKAERTNSRHLRDVFARLSPVKMRGVAG